MNEKASKAVNLGANQRTCVPGRTKPSVGKTVCMLLRCIQWHQRTNFIAPFCMSTALHRILKVLPGLNQVLPKSPPRWASNALAGYTTGLSSKGNAQSCTFIPMQPRSSTESKLPIGDEERLSSLEHDRQLTLPSPSFFTNPLISATIDEFRMLWLLPWAMHRKVWKKWPFARPPSPIAWSNCKQERGNKTNGHRQSKRKKSVPLKTNLSALYKMWRSLEREKCC